MSHVLTPDMRMHVSLDLAALREPFFAVPSPLAVLPAAQEPVRPLLQLLYVFGVDVPEEGLAVGEDLPTPLSGRGIAPEALLLLALSARGSLGDGARAAVVPARLLGVRDVLRKRQRRRRE